MSVKTQQCDIRNNTKLHTKGYMFRLYLSHLQALNSLKMTQVESKHVALRM
jgi:HKD family nuclease